MYKVYACQSDLYYCGVSLVAANSAAEANILIQDFKERDKGNLCDSRGYTLVSEYNVIKGLTSDRSGIIYQGIQYNYSS